MTGTALARLEGFDAGRPQNLNLPGYASIKGRLVFAIR
jgi:hypothetical protein